MDQTKLHAVLKKANNILATVVESSDLPVGKSNDIHYVMGLLSGAAQIIEFEEKYTFDFGIKPSTHYEN